MFSHRQHIHTAHTHLDMQNEIKEKEDFLPKERTNPLHVGREINVWEKKSNEPKFIPLNTPNAKYFPCACTLFAWYFFSLSSIYISWLNRMRSNGSKIDQAKVRMNEEDVYERSGTIVPISITSASFGNSHTETFIHIQYSRQEWFA